MWYSEGGMDSPKSAKKQISQESPCDQGGRRSLHAPENDQLQLEFKMFSFLILYPNISSENSHFKNILINLQLATFNTISMFLLIQRPMPQKDK